MSVGQVVNEREIYHDGQDWKYRDTDEKIPAPELVVPLAVALEYRPLMKQMFTGKPIVLTFPELSVPGRLVSRIGTPCGLLSRSPCLLVWA